MREIDKKILGAVHRARMDRDQFHIPAGQVMDYSPGCDYAIVAAQRGAYERKFAAEQSGVPAYYAMQKGMLEAEERPPMRKKRIDQREPPSILAMNPVRHQGQHVERFVGDVFSADFAWFFIMILVVCVFAMFTRIISLEAKVDALSRG